MLYFFLWCNKGEREFEWEKRNKKYILSLQRSEIFIKKSYFTRTCVCTDAVFDILFNKQLVYNFTLDDPKRLTAFSRECHLSLKWISLIFNNENGWYMKVQFYFMLFCFVFHMPMDMNFLHRQMLV